MIMATNNNQAKRNMPKLNCQTMAVCLTLALNCLLTASINNNCCLAADTLNDKNNNNNSFINDAILVNQNITKSTDTNDIVSLTKVGASGARSLPPIPPLGYAPGGPNYGLQPAAFPFGLDRVDEVCGLSMNDMRPDRIVGGRSTYFGEVPFVVHLRESQLFRVLGFNKCGGVLINHKWALTAGHCKPAFYSSLEVILGKYKTFEDAPPPNGTALASITTSLLGSSSSSSSSSTSSQQQSITDNLISTRPVDKQVLQMLADTVIVHPDYDSKTLENDIALVRFKNPVPYREDIQPICLPFIDEEFAGLDGYATGWGLVDFDKRQLPENLQIVRLPIMTNKRCQSMYKKAGHDKKITDHDLCAGYAKGGMDACEGDSGGPLIVRRPHDQRWVLAGIVSNGVKCGEPLLPGVYTRVSKFIPWIREQISLHS